MTEPTIICPKCKAEIKLTESLAAPLIESTRRDIHSIMKTSDIITGQRLGVLAVDAAAGGQ